MSSDDLFDSSPYGELDVSNTNEYEGITGEVRKELSAELGYPCFILPEDLEISEGSMHILARTLTATSDASIKVYLRDEDRVYLMGSLLPDSISSFLQIIGNSSVSVEGYLDESTKLSPRHFLALS